MKKKPTTNQARAMVNFSETNGSKLVTVVNSSQINIAAMIRAIGWLITWFCIGIRPMRSRRKSSNSPNKRGSVGKYSPNPPIPRSSKLIDSGTMAVMAHISKSRRTKAKAKAANTRGSAAKNK